ncbi:probable 1-deoxy-D-xylulose-5-phosphate synthase 2, chloroplastic [Tanacetum coccineum]
MRGIRRKDEGVLMMYKEFVVQLGGPVWDNAHMAAGNSYLGRRSLKFSCRCFNVSIAEQHAVTFAGLATEGLVMAPSDEAELINMVATTTTIDDRHRTRGAANGKSFHKEVSQMDEAEKPLRHRLIHDYDKRNMARALCPQEPWYRPLSIIGVKYGNNRDFAANFDIGLIQAKKKKQPTPAAKAEATGKTS